MDQTIEKVSFCAPDRNLDKAFSYICRDGTTRRWICHCFLALKDSVSTTEAQSHLTLCLPCPGILNLSPLGGIGQVTQLTSPLCPHLEKGGVFRVPECVRAMSLQSCLILCNPMDCKPARLLCPWDSPGKILEWVAVPSSKGSSRLRDQTRSSCVSCIGRQVLYQ